MKSRSIIYTPDGGIELTTVDIGDPGPGQLQVKTAACGVCAWDVITCKLGRKFKHPAPPGHEGIGYVTKVGPGVTSHKEGDRIVAGGFAEFVNRPAAGAYKIPDSPLADVDWIVEPVSCVVTGLDHCRLRAGDRVAVVGCGFMGLLMLQGLVRSFAAEVIGIDIDSAKLEIARKAGVREVHNVREEDPQQLASALKSRGIDCVIDTTGTQEGFDLSAAIVKRAGLINLFGWIKGERASFDPSAWHLGGFTIVNSSPSARLRDPFPPAIDLMHRGMFDLRPVVTHVVPLEGYAELMKKVVAGDPSYIKGVVTL